MARPSLRRLLGMGALIGMAMIGVIETVFLLLAAVR